MPEENGAPMWTARSGLVDFFAGGVGGAGMVMMSHPSDTVKLLLQAGKYKSSFQCLKDMLRQPLSLFRGMSFPLAATPFMNAVVFWSYTGSLVRIQPESEGARMWTVAAAGAAAGAVTTLISCPVELAKIQLQMQAPPGIRFEGAASATRRFNGPIDVLNQAVHRGGVGALFQGVGPTFYREVFGYGAQFVGYEVVLKYMRSCRGGPLDCRDNTVFEKLMAGGLAGMVSWLASYPFDVVKSVIQARPLGHGRLVSDGAMALAKHIVRTRGWRGLWAGIVPCLLPSFPANAVGFVLYELVVTHMVADDSRAGSVIW